MSKLMTAEGMFNFLFGEKTKKQAQIEILKEMVREGKSFRTKVLENELVWSIKQGKYFYGEKPTCWECEHMISLTEESKEFYCRANKKNFNKLDDEFCSDFKPEGTNKHAYDELAVNELYQDSIWYGGFVGSHEQSGETLVLEAHGEIYIKIKRLEEEEEYDYLSCKDNSGQMTEILSEYETEKIHGDDLLRTLQEQERIEWINNNWFSLKLVTNDDKVIYDEEPWEGTPADFVRMTEEEIEETIKMLKK